MGNLTITSQKNLYVPSFAYRNFIARTGGVLNTTYQNALKGLLDGMTNDGMFNPDGTPVYHDSLWTTSLQTQTVGNLNLVSSNFTLSPQGGITWTQGQGYLGENNSTTKYVDTGCNPSTNMTKYTRDNAHEMIWIYADYAQPTGFGGFNAGLSAADFSNKSPMFVIRWNDNHSYWAINAGDVTQDAGIASQKGCWILNRSDASHIQLYHDGVDQGIPNSNSLAVLNGNIYLCANNHLGTGPESGTAATVCAYSLGAGMSAATAAKFTTRMRTFMTEIGVP